MYRNAVISILQGLVDIDKVIKDTSIAAMMTPRFDPLIIAFENSTVQISSDLVKLKF